jgi:hypothetical protein
MFFVIIIGVIAFGCKSYVQVLNTKSTNVKVENDLYVFENDSLKITYSFWNEKGILSFAIYNKLDKPLYIDWKKSSYIDNSVKLNYWVEEEKIKTTDAYGSYYYDGPILMPGFAVASTVGISSSSRVKVERITFIPPKSNYYRSQFYIFPNLALELSTQAPYKVVSRNDKPKKKTKIYEEYYSIDNTPLTFRNFLTFSISEDFKNEFYIDNGFYISGVMEMDERNFQYIEKGSLVMVSKFVNGSSFYNFVPKENSVEGRK